MPCRVRNRRGSVLVDDRIGQVGALGRRLREGSSHQTLGRIDNRRLGIVDQLPGGPSHTYAVWGKSHHRREQGASLPVTDHFNRSVFLSVGDQRVGCSQVNSNHMFQWVASLISARRF